MTRVLVVDDEPQIRRALSINLRARGYEVDAAASGEEALQRAAARVPDLVVLDLGLPGIDGVEVIRGLRGWTTVPIVVLSVRDQERDKVAALDAGADDYVTKPFGMDELLARVRANLRRVRQRAALAGDVTIEVGDLVVEPAQMRATVRGVPARLRLKEFQLLVALVRNEGKLMTRQRLAEEVWGYDFMATSRTIDVHIRRLRQAIEDASDYTYVQTVHGAGYRFEPVPKTDGGATA